MIRDLIDAIAEGNTLAIDDSFNAVMASKISERLDDLRVSVAQNVFGSVKESVELDEAVGTAAKYAGKTGLMGGKYKSTDKALELTGDKFNAWRAKQSAKRSAEHKGQDPKLASAGYGKHMVDIEKAKKNADARGVDASHLNWKHRNGVVSNRRLPEEFEDYSVDESVELDEAVGTAAKYAGKTGLMGGKYKSTDKAIELTGDKFNAWRAKQSAKKSAEHKGQDPKLAAAGYGKHMVDIEKAKKNADARGVDASHLNWKHRNGVTSRKLPEEFDLDEAREERGDMGTDNSPKGSARGSSLHSMDIAKQSGYTHAVMHMGAKGGIDSYHTTKAGADKKLALLRKKHNIPENSPRARIAEL